MYLYINTVFMESDWVRTEEYAPEEVAQSMVPIEESAIVEAVDYAEENSFDI